MWKTVTSMSNVGPSITGPVEISQSMKIVQVPISLLSVVLTSKENAGELLLSIVTLIKDGNGLLTPPSTQ